MPSTWNPSLGAIAGRNGAAFKVWSPSSRVIEVVVERLDGPIVHRLERSPEGVFSSELAGVGPGDRYRYRLEDERLLPDPASRYQPDGVHGSSQVVDPNLFRWTDGRWTGLALEDVILYELHVGTFTVEGTFAGVTRRLPDIAALGITAIELMPVADFPGDRNWGYDGVALFAPARCYGAPDDLRSLVDAAHALGLGVFLDVVYNHLGPDGAYLSAFSPHYFTDRHQTPWGEGVNFDGEHSARVREFFIENALHWIHEYHVDGLRLDATHAMADDGPRHFLAELTSRVGASVTDRRVLIVAEDHRNLRTMLTPEHEGGWGIDAVWADDFHHQCRRLLAGDDEGYYRDFTGSTKDLATTIRRGWFFTGQRSQHLGESRGTDPDGIPPARFVFCLQNHDQVGNRALGERLHHQVDDAAYRAASALLLLAPQTPLLFMGQEWASSTPFLFFTDHHPELGRLVTAGRRNEFRHFAAFSGSTARADIPDPQAFSTFGSSRLLWEERTREPHASTLRLYRALLALRRQEPAFRRTQPWDVWAQDEGTIVLLRAGTPETVLVITRLKGAGTVAVPLPRAGARGARLRIIFTTEDSSFSSDPDEPAVSLSSGSLIVHFRKPFSIVVGVSAE